MNRICHNCIGHIKDLEGKHLKRKVLHQGVLQGLNGKVIPEENRQIRCQCGHKEDRDINAARNILYKGVPVVQLRGLWLRPNAPQSEAMKQSKDAEQIVVSQINPSWI
jgi:transposase